jgi:acyl-CoA thioester hydrolase
VIYGDTDKMGFAYHANYLRWFEMGRTELFRSWGLSYKSIESKGIFLPVSEAYCKFLIPARYDEVLGIETSIDTGVRGGIKFNYVIYAEDGVKILARGYSKHACVNSDGRVTRPPPLLTELIKKHCNDDP